MEETRTIRGAPLIKWPGGKSSLLTELFHHVPLNVKKYYEPFFGGGALFFALKPHRAVLSDTNRELINCYSFVKTRPEGLIRILRRYENSEDAYYRIRAKSPRTDLQRAARLLYLTRLSFNGIHRVNRRGEFNVPYGQKTHLTTVDDVRLRQTSLALRNAVLRCDDFQSATRDAKEGDFIFFDPPYTVAHANNGFLKYNERIFSWADQERLALHARDLAARGCTVIVANADHESTVKLYRGFRNFAVERYSRIAASSAHRRPVTERFFTLGGEGPHA